MSVVQLAALVFLVFSVLVLVVGYGWTMVRAARQARANPNGRDGRGIEISFAEIKEGGRARSSMRSRKRFADSDERECQSRPTDKRMTY